MLATIYLVSEFGKPCAGKGYFVCVGVCTHLFAHSFLYLYTCLHEYVHVCVVRTHNFYTTH